MAAVLIVACFQTFSSICLENGVHSSSAMAYARNPIWITLFSLPLCCSLPHWIDLGASVLCLLTNA